MESAASISMTILSRLGNRTSTSDAGQSIADWEQRKADRYNASAGHLNDDGSFDCRLCLNRGNFAKVNTVDGRVYTVYEVCKCVKTRQSVWRMRASGLENTIRQCTFERFEAREPWQSKMLGVAQGYLADGLSAGLWLFMGGAVGCGKTHLCTAVCRSALFAGMGVYYMPWQSESVRLKAAVNDAEEYEPMVRRLKTVELLYIDDFFKPTYNGGILLPPTGADVRLAYDILNYRYINHAPTIISSERYIAELMDIDEAVASRIYEMTGDYKINIKREKIKNHRISDCEPV